MWLNDFYHSLNPIAFSLGFITIRWYALAYIAGFISCGAMMYRTAKRWDLSLSLDALISLINAAIFGVIVGGRLAYVLFYAQEYYIAHPLEILDLSQGGMSFHGGLVGAVFAGWLVCRLMKFSILTVLDLAVCGAPIGLFFGRCANFINGELWGKPTDLSWGVVFSNTGGGFIPRHPSQLYEALLEGIVLFLILYMLSRKKNPLYEGMYFGIFLLCYGAFRFAVEFVRLPDIQLGYLFGTNWLTMGQILSVPLIFMGVMFICHAYISRKPQVLSVR